MASDTPYLIARTSRGGVLAIREVSPMFCLSGFDEEDVRQKAATALESYERMTGVSIAGIPERHTEVLEIMDVG